MRRFGLRLVISSLAVAGSIGACGARTGLEADQRTIRVVDAATRDALDAQLHSADIEPHLADAVDEPEAACSCQLAVSALTQGAACAAAASDTSSLGCEFWPTTLGTAALVGDFGIAVSNPGADAVEFEIMGSCGQVARRTLAPGEHASVVLPWVDSLKTLGGTGGVGASVRSVRQRCGAYRLVSTAPVAVTQFSPLEGLPYSHVNDASRLRPTSALGTHYRVAGYPRRAGEPANDGYFAVVAVEDATQVTVTLPPSGAIRGGDGIDEVPFGGATTLTMNSGDVVELVASARSPSDVNGAVIDATKPVQVMTGHPCAFNPAPEVWCDHLEQSLAPLDRLGDHYVVPVPSHPLAAHAPGGHSVIFVGAFDGTDLVYAPAPPPGAPLHLDAGSVVDVGRVSLDFDVRATHPFVLLTMMLGSSQLDTLTYEGDPSFGAPHDVREYRTRVPFFTPPGYDRTLADVVAPAGATLLLDGVQSTAAPSPIVGSPFAVHRLEIQASGGHVLTATGPVGVQVMGYANAQSYLYPATGAPE